MSGGWKTAAPLLGKLHEGTRLLEALQRASEEDGDICGMCFSDEALEQLEGNAYEFSDCRFERCTFRAMDVNRLSFVDCIFEKCEWSNARLINATFQRTLFNHCRLTGMEWQRGMLMNTVFDGCMMDYVSLSETRLERVVFQDCCMRQSLWADIRLNKVRFERADLAQAQWIRTPLAGQDMSSCEIAGWSISLFDLKGMKVTPHQLIELSGLLGVEVV